MKSRHYAALACGVVSLALPAAASAATISIPSTLELTGKVVVTVPVTYNCQQLSSFFPVFPMGQVSIEQAVGKELAQGTGSYNPTCDGTAHTANVSITSGSGIGPFPSGNVPFRNGAAVTSASLTDCTGFPFPPFTSTCDNGSTGWQAVKLQG